VSGTRTRGHRPQRGGDPRAATHLHASTTHIHHTASIMMECVSGLCSGLAWQWGTGSERHSDTWTSTASVVETQGRLRTEHASTTHIHHTASIMMECVSGLCSGLAWQWGTGSERHSDTWTSTPAWWRPKGGYTLTRLYHSHTPHSVDHDGVCVRSVQWTSLAVGNRE